jgi:hypothetical protein
LYAICKRRGLATTAAAAAASRSRQFFQGFFGLENFTTPTRIQLKRPKTGFGTGLPEIKPKIKVWVNFGGPRNEKSSFGLYYLWSFGIFFGHLVN